MDSTAIDPTLKDIFLTVLNEQNESKSATTSYTKRRCAMLRPQRPARSKRQAIRALWLARAALLLALIALACSIYL